MKLKKLCRAPATRFWIPHTRGVTNGTQGGATAQGTNGGPGNGNPMGPQARGGERPEGGTAAASARLPEEPPQLPLGGGRRHALTPPSCRGGRTAAL